MTDGNIHYEHPFVPPVEAREPWRRLRGRLTAPVTVWTSGAGEERAGLTISSLLVADGRPPVVLGLMKETTDLYAAIRATGSFLVHVLDRTHAALSEEFAGLRPRPGGPFAGRRVEKRPHGPVLSDIPDRAYCRLVDDTEAGYQRLVRGAVEDIEVSELTSPLVLFRGRYRSLDSAD